VAKSNERTRPSGRQRAISEVGIAGCDSDDHNSMWQSEWPGSAISPIFVHTFGVIVRGQSVLDKI
jgi:hypothetical protein